MILITKLRFVIIINNNMSLFKKTKKNQTVFKIMAVFLFVLKAAFVDQTAGRNLHRNVCSSSAQEILPWKLVMETVTEIKAVHQPTLGYYYNDTIIWNCTPRRKKLEPVRSHLSHHCSTVVPPTPTHGCYCAVQHMSIIKNFSDIIYWPCLRSECFCDKSSDPTP